MRIAPWSSTEDDKIDGEAFKKLIRAAVEINRKGKDSSKSQK